MTADGTKSAGPPRKRRGRPPKARNPGADPAPAQQPAGKYPGVAKGLDYARAVVAGLIPVCQLVVLACKRTLNDIEAAAKPDSAWEFRPDLAERPMIFAGLMPNIKGPMAGKPLCLLPWQCFVMLNLFGFVARGTDARRYRQGTVYVPRGNGKTTFAAPIALYCSFVEGEGGAEGYAGAVTRDQARILFDAAREMTRRSQEFQGRFGVDPRAHRLIQDKSASFFEPLASDGDSLDGKNIAVVVLDEIASHKTSEVYDAMLTGMGKRKHPLMVNISTATGNNAGIGRQLWDYGVKVLTGAVVDDRFFFLAYTVDEGDDIWDLATWKKANPSWGEAVQPDAFTAIASQARQNPAQEAAFKTRHLNIWVTADDALFDISKWNKCAVADLTLAAVEGQKCWGALDMATVSDITAAGLVFRGERDGKRIRRLFVRMYLPEQAIIEQRNPYYAGWVRDGHLIVTPGDVTDFEFIESDVLAFAERFSIQKMGYDPYQGHYLSQRLVGAAALNMEEFRMVTANLSPPTKELDRIMRNGELEHEGNPALAWCLSNVVGRYDANDNVFPRKTRPENKIDGAVAVIMALGLELSDNEKITTSYLESDDLILV